MLSTFLEWCADLALATNRARRAQFNFVGVLFTIVVCGLLSAQRWGMRAIALTVVVLACVALAGLEIREARLRLWRAALAEPQPQETPTYEARGHDLRFWAPTARALLRLADAVMRVRLGRFDEAREVVANIERALLRREELRLLEAVRASVSLALGDERRAARQAILALPTGSPDLDERLGRGVLRSAWGSPRLDVVDTAWERAGVGLDGSPLGRLRQLVRLARGGEVPVDLSPDEALRLAEEARELGEHELAQRIRAQSRPTAGYR